MTTETNTNDRTEIYTALVNAQKSAQAVAKGGRNNHANYNYATAESIIEEARTALNENGLALLTGAYNVVPYENTTRLPEHVAAPPTGKVCVNYTLVHTSGQSMNFYAETSTIVEKGRPQDKAEASALTYNIGYFLRGLLCLPRVSDTDDVDQRNDMLPAPPLKMVSKPSPVATATPATTPGHSLDPAVTEVLGLIAAATDASALTALAEVVTAKGVAKNQVIRTAFANRSKELSK
jgi:hypothetical protein